jgi:hypothetical protein
MDDFNNRSNMDPITYAVMTGDTSRGASVSDLGRSYGSLEDDTKDLTYCGTNTGAGSVLALVLSIAFLVVAILSW